MFPQRPLHLNTFQVAEIRLTPGKQCVTPPQRGAIIKKMKKAAYCTRVASGPHLVLGSFLMVAPRGHAFWKWPVCLHEKQRKLACW